MPALQPYLSVFDHFLGLHSSDSPIFKGGEGGRGGGGKFWLLPPEGGGSEKLQKGGSKYGAGAPYFLKGGSWHFPYLIFTRFIIFTFRNYFTLCRFVLCIWRKIIFFCHHNFMKKDHSRLSKTEPENIL